MLPEEVTQLEVWPDQENSEDDFLSPEFVSDTVVFSTDWTIETILSQIKKNNIDLSPRFQRRDAWSNARKSRFIESLFLGLPIPQVVLAEQKSAKGKYLVLDGKQRLLSIAMFSEIYEGHSLKLTGLEALNNLNGMTLSDVKDDIKYSDLLTSFENQTMRAVIIRNWRRVDLLHAIFVRLNTGSVQLSPQELRQALYSGPLMNFLSEYTEQETHIRSLLNISEPDFRMRDAEILLRILAFRLNLGKYKGNLKAFLDEFCEFNNNNWPEREPLIKNTALQIEKAIVAGEAIFPKGLGRKWKDEEYEGRLNRAVLDCQIFFLLNNDLREKCIAKSNEVELAWKQLCQEPEFLSSVEGTTKSISAVRTRFGQWADKLSAVLDSNIVIELPANAA